MEVVVEQFFDAEIDTSGLSCPLPILKTKKILSQLESGQVVKVIATDVNSLQDFLAFANQTGHEILQQITQDNGKIIHYVKRR